jgi:hypothetical protein
MQETPEMKAERERLESIRTALNEQASKLLEALHEATNQIMDELGELSSVNPVLGAGCTYLAEALATIGDQPTRQATLLALQRELQTRTDIIAAKTANQPKINIVILKGHDT